MFHVKQIAMITALSIITLSTFAQGTSTNTTNNLSLLNKEEQEVLLYVNLLRADPQAFYTKYIIPYFDNSPFKITAFYRNSLKSDINAAKDLQAYNISPQMQVIAQRHAKDLVDNNNHQLSHNSTNGQSFSQRMAQAHVSCAGENLYNGENRSALQMVMDLLIDQGVQSLGHRKALLSPNYNYIGIAIEHYPGDGRLMVQDFSCD